MFLHWFSIKLFDTVKYEFIVLYMLITALITDSTPKYEQICWTRPYLFKQQKIWSLWILCEKYTNSMKTLAKFTTQLCFVKQPSVGNDHLVPKLLKRTGFHLFTETISFSWKLTNQTLNRFYYYLISSATDNKIHL